MKKNSFSRILSNSALLIAILAASFAFFGPSTALAAPPVREEFFICPSVSTHNPNGMWVMGAHGAYYVLIPTKGGANDNSLVFLTVRKSPLYILLSPSVKIHIKDLPTFPYFEGMVVLLGEGIDTWLGSPAGWEEFDMAMVMNNGNDSYDVYNKTRDETITIYSPIPLASAAVW